MKMRTLLFVVGMVFGSAVAAHAQAPAPVVKNPRAVLFECPDHDRDTGHELDIIEAATGKVVQTIVVGDPAKDGNGDVRVTINVQPIDFGRYVIKARATFATIVSPDSEPSPVWERAPGGPSRLRVE